MANSRAVAKGAVRHSVVFSKPKDMKYFFSVTDAIKPYLDKQFEDWSVDIGMHCEVVAYRPRMTKVQATRIASALKAAGAKGVRAKTTTVRSR